MSEDAMRMSAVYKGNKFTVGDAVLYVDPDEVEHTLIITDITRVDGFLHASIFPDFLMVRVARCSIFGHITEPSNFPKSPT